MDTKDLLQMNNFAGGMNTDTSDMVLSEDSYRLANNLRYITNTQENSGELHLIEGASKVASIEGKIIASTNLRDIPIFVVEGGNGWLVYKYIDNALKCVADIYEEDNRVIGHKLSLVTRYEDETNLKLYIADGFGPVLCIQLYTNSSEIPTKLHDVESIPFVKFKKPIFCGLIGGNIKAAVVEYSYQFYKKYGQLSEISPSTKLIPLYKGDITAKESNRILGYLPDEQTDKGVRIRIPIDRNTINPFDRVKIFRISYLETGQLPTIECISDEKIPYSGDITFDDIGLQSLAVYSLEEYNSMTGIHIVPKVIESKDDILFAANIKDESTGFDIGDWDASQNVTYEFVTVDLVGDNSVNPDLVLSKPKTLVERNGLPIIVTDPPMLKQSIETSNGTFDLSDYIDTSNLDVLGYWNPQVSYMFKSLRNGEKYRFGIILYDNKGRSSGVCHIKDIDVNLQTDRFYINDEGRLMVKPIGLKFKVLNLPENTASYEIVRCGRSVFDVLTITLGVITKPIAREYTDRRHRENFPLTPTGYMTVHESAFFAGSLNLGTAISTNVTGTISLREGSIDFNGNPNTYLFASPEVCYLYDTTKDMLKNSQLYLQLVDYICPKAFVNSEEIQNHTYNKSVYGDSRTIVNYGNKYANTVPITSTAQNAVWAGGHEDWRSVLASDYIPATTLEYDDPFRDLSGVGNRFQYAKMYYKITNPVKEQNRTKEINSIGFPETLSWDDFATPEAEKFTLKYPDKVTAVGGRNFVNWVCGCMYGKSDLSDPDTKINIDSLKNSDYENIDTMGPGGKCIVFSSDLGTIAYEDVLIGTYICNIKKKTAMSATESQKKISTYRSFGDYFSADQDECYIFDGDCFIQVFEYISQHKFAHSSSPYYRTACRVFAFPLESSINLAYTSGYELNKEYDNAEGDISYVQDLASNVNNQFIQDRPLYSYNSAYSTIDTSKTFVSKLLKDENDSVYTDFRVYHSNIKSNNETIDSWLKYQPANFLDVDTRKGPITNLRTFKNQLVFWQEYATGLLSVNERSMISDDSNLPLILGSGGVLSRFDYITNTNGMHTDDYSDTQSNTTLYWWDRINKSICGYSGGQDAIELSKIKFVLNYLNKNQPIDNPLLAYDNKTKEVVANVVNGKDKEKGSIVYNEHIGHFTSIYTIDPKTKVELPDGLLFTTNSDIYKWNKLNGKFATGFGNKLFPYIKHVVNHNGMYTKVFDNAEFAGRVYGGDDLSDIKLKFSTPLKQHAELSGKDIQNREYNFRYIIPRNGEDEDNQATYGDRLRGKTMQCELESSSNSYDFSLQYIKTKFRISWS